VNKQRSRTLLATGLALVAAGAMAVGHGHLRETEAQEKADGKAGLAELSSRVQEIVLPNGLRILVLERHAAPTVAFATAVNVGAVDEITGETGLAHMFEHMAFKGSTSVGTSDYAKEKVALEEVEKTFAAYRKALVAGAPKAEVEALKKTFEETRKAADAFNVNDEFSTILQRNGGAGLNAFTAADETVYHVELPSNRLELWFMLESDRFMHPVLRQFYTEKNNVEEERRMRTESNPEGKLFEEFLACAFRAHPYARPVIGYMSDLEALSATTAKRFFDRHYTPNNMVISIVGDVDVNQVRALAEKYFGPMPRGPEIEPVPTIETKQVGERRCEVESDSQPVVVLGWHGPAARNDDSIALDALSDVLSTGRTSRMYKSLIVEKKIAVAAQAGIGEPGQKYPNLFIAFAVPAPGKTNDDCVKAIDEEIGKVRKDLVAEEELASVKTRARANFLRGLRGNLGLAQGLSIRQTIYGEWKSLFEQSDKIEKLTPEDLRRVAQKYLTHSNRSRGDIVKPYATDKAEKPKKTDDKQPADGKKD
jgi:predicted Zn-dependent peptidase